MPVKEVRSMGWSRQPAVVSVLLAMEEQRRQAGVRVAKLRKARNWSDEELAQRSGLSVKTVSRFQAGRHEARSNTVRSLAKAFGVSEAEITGPPPAPLGLGVEPQRSATEARLERIERALVENNLLLRELARHSGVTIPTPHDVERQLVDLLEGTEGRGPTESPLPDNSASAPRAA